MRRHMSILVLWVDEFRVSARGVNYDTPPSGRWSLVKKRGQSGKRLTKETFRGIMMLLEERSLGK